MKKNIWEPGFTVKRGFTNIEQGKSYKYSEVLDWHRLHQCKLTVFKYI